MVEPISKLITSTFLEKKVFQLDIQQYDDLVYKVTIKFQKLLSTNCVPITLQLGGSSRKTPHDWENDTENWTSN